MSSKNAIRARPSYVIASSDLRENEGQWQAYQSEGNCVLLAGPGSGKTKTLTIKMARMLHEDVANPRGIACITYNNQCARELRRRLGDLGVEDGRRVSIGTLHSFCLQHLILPYAHLTELPVPDPVSVATVEEQKKCWADAVSTVISKDENPRDWEFRCSTYRRTHLDRDNTEWHGDGGDTANVIEAYENALHSKGVIDFDGMVLNGLQLVEQFEWVQKAIRAKFPILVVDEYQDLGHALHRIVQCLCFKAGLRLLAVGDPDQSVYGFTGAEPALLNNLSESDSVETVHLKLNYRCGPTIIKASETALGEKRDFESNSVEEGTVDLHYRPKGIADQVDYVCDSIIPSVLKRRDDLHLGNIAVLYHSKNEGDIIAQGVERIGWNFIRIDQGNPYPRSPVISWLEECAAWCSDGWKLGSPRLSSILHDWLRFNHSIISDAELRTRRNELVKFLHSNRLPTQSLNLWLTKFHSSCLRNTLEYEHRLGDDKIAVQKLLDISSVNSPLENFTVSTFSGQRGSTTHLNLMTLHSAKGLEFDVVVIIGLEEGLLPNFRSTTQAALREDRRLFYVGLTRARSEVHLVYSGWYTNAYGRRFKKGPSRFVNEVKSSLNSQ